MKPSQWPDPSSTITSSSCSLIRAHDYDNAMNVVMNLNCQSTTLAKDLLDASLEHWKDRAGVVDAINDASARRELMEINITTPGFAQLPAFSRDHAFQYCHLDKERYNDRHDKPFAKDGCAKFSSQKLAWQARAGDGGVRGRWIGREDKRVIWLARDVPQPRYAGRVRPHWAGGYEIKRAAALSQWLRCAVGRVGEFGDRAGDFYNLTVDLREYLNAMVVNYWTLVTTFVNALVSVAQRSECLNGRLLL
ncbi:hypothetical protein P885DRAFT_64244 [Corynascus similis CBS 632.67]